MSVIIFFPVLCGVLMILWKESFMRKIFFHNVPISARSFGIFVGGIEIVLCGALFWYFDSHFSGFQFIHKIPLIDTLGIAYFVGVDGISLFLVLLSALIGFLGIVFISPDTPKLRYFIANILLLQGIVIGVFCALDVMMFYIFWELTLVPSLFIIGIWGGERRIYAGVKFFLYTFSASLVMLVGIVYYAYVFHLDSGVWSFNLLDWYDFNLNVQSWLFIAFFLAFGVKSAMFPLHTWLPYAYGQAPIVGSVLLSALLSKMGIYGIIRFCFPLFPVASVDFTFIISIICVCMVVYGAFLAYAQKDIKQVVAYSSISHIGVIILGVFSLNVEGISGAVFFMVAHGIISAMLFMLVGVIQERKNTSMIESLGGLASIMPKFSTLFAIALLGSVGLPLTIGFVGEFLSLYGFFKVNKIITLLAGLSVVMGAVYMLSVFGRVFLGKLDSKTPTLNDVNAREKCALIPLALLIIAFGIYPKPILLPAQNSALMILDVVDSKLNYFDPLIPHTIIDPEDSSVVEKLSKTPLEQDEQADQSTQESMPNPTQPNEEKSLHSLQPIQDSNLQNPATQGE
ncbi:complex I subunit 4 family protein [Helicobacter sp. 23-1048]